jgi:hypothetical protein
VGFKASLDALENGKSLLIGTEPRLPVTVSVAMQLWVQSRSVQRTAAGMCDVVSRAAQCSVCPLLKLCNYPRFVMEIRDRM